jgi:glycosyltransferase involved in cell wall biosynthesis
MQIAYTTTFDASDVHNWSGTPYHMSKALGDAGMTVEYIGSLQRKLPPFFKVKQTVKKYLCDQRESPRFNCHVAQQYSDQVAAKLKNSLAKVVVSPLINPIAYLDCKQPIVLWTDALYAALLGFYPPFAYHSASSVTQGNEITTQCLARAKLAIFSSDWAANSALELYGASRDKVKVVNFGANIETYPTYTEIQDVIKKRATNKIKLLFLAKSWERKGGDIVLAVAKALHESGHAVELSIVGYTPDIEKNLPYANCLGFISKQKPEGKAKLYELLCDSHFLFVPSRADACPMVFAEANAYGLPCLTTYVGGISTAVRDNINGMTFGLDANVKVYCDYIVNLMHDRKRYEALALSAYHEYESRLNWGAATKQVKKLIEELM